MANKALCIGIHTKLFATKRHLKFSVFYHCDAELHNNINCSQQQAAFNLLVGERTKKYFLILHIFAKIYELKKKKEKLSSTLLQCMKPTLSEYNYIQVAITCLQAFFNLLFFIYLVLYNIMRKMNNVVWRTRADNITYKVFNEFTYNTEYLHRAQNNAENVNSVVLCFIYFPNDESLGNSYFRYVMYHNGIVANDRLFRK